ncbi:PIN-like domain-containing protein [Acinetobacter baumannii]|uniref:PIN-like domain-containing protein n=1 Tax=Acinetobacter baumannii TaxID=470 RepID=UPI0033233C28
MKEAFISFYENHEDNYLKSIWNSPNTRFILDTNVLLSLYSFQKESREDFIDILKFLNSRLWIPHHVALEFQRNRLKVIKNHRIYIQDMQKETDDFLNSISFDDKILQTFKNKFTSKSKHLNIYTKVEDIISSISSEIEDIRDLLKDEIGKIKKLIADIDQDKIYINSNDYIRDELDNIFKNNSLGKNIYNKQELLDEVFKEGEKRYKTMTPPGFKDGIAKENDIFSFNGLNYQSKFGDLIIFKQIIEFSKDSNIKNIIFISEDVKEDWRIVENFNGKKILGARPELKQEILNKASIDNFYIFNINDFLNHTNNSFDLKLKPSSVDDIKNSLSVNENYQDMEDYFTANSDIDNNFKKEIKNIIHNHPNLNLSFDPLLLKDLSDLNLKIENLNKLEIIDLENIKLPNFPFFDKKYEEIKEYVLKCNAIIEHINNPSNKPKIEEFLELLKRFIRIVNLLIDLDIHVR